MAQSGSVAESLEGTWEELVMHAEQFRGKRLRLTVVADEGPPSVDDSQSLADLLGDYLGGIAGSGANNSEDTGRKFTDYLARKHQEGRL